MAISSALSFLSDRKRPIVVSVSLFLFNPAPSALPFFFSSARIATFPPPQTRIPVSADASPPETPAAVTSDGSNNSAADPPRPDTTTPASDVAASAPEPDHSTPPPAAAETTGSVDTNETTATVLGERDGDGEGGSGGGEEPVEVPSWEVCEVGKGVEAADYIQCLDNVKAVKALKSLRHMEHRERHCPTAPRPRCLVPLSAGYRLPVPWPRSRDMIQTLPQMLLKLKLAISVCFIYTIAGNLVISYSLCKFQIWYNNVPHPNLVEYKKDQNWVRKSGNYFVLPGIGTQFKAGVTRYIQFIEQFPQEKFDSDTKHWNDLVSEVYFSDFAVNWSSGRNVMDMNGSFGGFVASLIDPPLWVMNVVPFDQPDTLPIIFNRGLIGVYYDWCESFNTYPRTYDLLHMRYLLQGLTNRCDIIEVAAEIDRILRSGRWFVLQDTIEVIRKMDPVLRSLHYKTAIVKQQFLVATKGLWRPDSTVS